MSNSRTAQLRATLNCAALFWCCLDLPSYAQFTTTLNVPPEANIGDNESIGSGTQLNLFDGGQIGNDFDARGGSEVNVSGGSIGDDFQAFSGSVVNISGGSVGRFFDTRSVVNLSGGEIGSGFNAFPGSIVEISGGSVGSNFAAFSGSEVNISGGSVGPVFRTFSGSRVSISGGEIGFASGANGFVNISGGEIGSSFGAFSGSAVNISGGTIGDGFRATSGGTVNIAGGEVGEDFHANSGSEVNLYGTEFLVDDIDITSWLTPNVPVTFDFRNVTLSGLLFDGEPFSFDLNSTSSAIDDFFAHDATLSITLVDTIPGDFNGDGTVGTADYTVWRDGLDSVFTPGHYHVWKANFGEVAAVSTASVQVPEPIAIWLIGAATLIICLRRAAWRKPGVPRTNGLSHSQ